MRNPSSGFGGRQEAYKPVKDDSGGYNRDYVAPSHYGNYVAHPHVWDHANMGGNMPPTFNNYPGQGTPYNMGPPATYYQGSGLGLGFGLGSRVGDSSALNDTLMDRKAIGKQVMGELVCWVCGKLEFGC